jgi:hypothetical protein
MVVVARRRVCFWEKLAPAERDGARDLLCSFSLLLLRTQTEGAEHTNIPVLYVSSSQRLARFTTACLAVDHEALTSTLFSVIARVHQHTLLCALPCFAASKRH